METNVKYNFKDKVIFITGASTGIGRETAIEFGQAGAQVVLADVNFDKGSGAAHLINDSGGKAHFIKCDVSDPGDVQVAIDQTVSLFGKIDFAFNNAGIEGVSSKTAECTEKNWDHVLSINLKGIWLCMKYQIAQMEKQGHGVIVNCSSVAGLVGFSGSAAYVASKHGVIGLTKTAALDYAKQNIRVNAVCPGIIETDMIERFVHGDEQIKKALSDSEPVGRMGKPSEVAQTVLWLCSDSASFITGHAVAVDGGWVAQ